MELIDFLKKRDENKTNSEAKIEKSYVPYGITSFEQLDAYENVEEYAEHLREMFYQFVVIGDNIISMYPNEAVDMLSSLVKEFNGRMLKLQNEFKSGSVALFKSHDGNLYWAGVPTNKFQDREHDIFSDISHRKLVKSLESGVAEYPDLYIWHRKPAVGKATWVDYDERGFLVAGGIIHKEYESLVMNLVANSTEPLGMSQGIYRKDIKFDSDGAIIEYTPFEFTFLPHKNACNLLTAFSTNEG